MATMSSVSAVISLCPWTEKGARMTRHNKVISLGRKTKGARKVMTSEFGLCCKIRSAAWTTKRKGQP